MSTGIGAWLAGAMACAAGSALAASDDGRLDNDWLIKPGASQASQSPPPLPAATIHRRWSGPALAPGSEDSSRQNSGTHSATQPPARHSIVRPGTYSPDEESRDELP
jgi:hypothetical protein